MCCNGVFPHGCAVMVCSLMVFRLQAVLATHGIPTQTQKQVEPIKIRSPADILMKVLAFVQIFLA